MAVQQSAQPARVRAYEWVRNGILTGRLESGSFIDEATVCQAVGVSRTPVREAFHQLSAEKFMVHSPRRGAQVRTVTATELIEVYDSRRLIEGHAGRLVCERELPLPDELTELLDRMEAVDAGTLEGTDLNYRFHRGIVSAAGNTVLTELYEALSPRLLRVSLMAMTARPERRTHIDSEHRLLLKALRERDTDGFLGTLDAHLRPIEAVLAALPGR
ncbi:GntR family transcriptional regulator [Murinocardiopsis flavida]|uniref:GntR family transcriptional regulator n=1 Tax=Murinocardiopsis flavida TaxID=645275 RepID=A0A2P8DSV0_9ACTN|nr:GntR family transcriptional regulator [Murinocardiopsis flavida]PSL00293.1 GntR family transcriptional regulator [Murinocardiopsis flavida]